MVSVPYIVHCGGGTHLPLLAVCECPAASMEHMSPAALLACFFTAHQTRLPQGPNAADSCPTLWGDQPRPGIPRGAAPDSGEEACEEGSSHALLAHLYIADVGARRAAASCRRSPWDPSAWLVAPWCGATACSVWTLGESPVVSGEEACEEGSYALPAHTCIADMGAKRVAASHRRSP